SISKDFTNTQFFVPNTSSEIRYIHKIIGQTDLYFLANKSGQPSEALCAFRVQGKRPELWWPDTGRIESPALYEQINGTLRLPLHFDPNGSVFVIFRAPAEADRIVSVTRNEARLLETHIESGKLETTETNRDLAHTFTMA